jgi:phosphate transport system substrate-binding protein
MKRFVRVAKAAAVVLTSALLISCGSESTEGRGQFQAALQIKGAGATFPEPLYQKWIARYK